MDASNIWTSPFKGTDDPYTYKLTMSQENRVNLKKSREKFKTKKKHGQPRSIGGRGNQRTEYWNANTQKWQGSKPPSIPRKVEVEKPKPETRQEKIKSKGLADWRVNPDEQKKLNQSKSSSPNVKIKPKEKTSPPESKSAEVKIKKENSNSDTKEKISKEQNNQSVNNESSPKADKTTKKKLSIKSGFSEKQLKAQKRRLKFKTHKKASDLLKLRKMK